MKTKKILTKIFIALALTFMIPQLVLLYLWEDLSTRSTLLIFGSTALLVCIGAMLIWDIIQSIRTLFRNIDQLSKKELHEDTPSTDRDEVQRMDNSIELISKKIVEDMEELQHSAALIEKTKKDLSDTLLDLESVMNSMGDALVVIDSKYKVQRVNHATRALLKLEETDLIGKAIDNLFEDLDEDVFFKEEGITGKRMTCITRENEKIPVDVNIQPQIDIIGDRIGHVLVVRDMRTTLGLISRLERANTVLQEPALKSSLKVKENDHSLEENRGKIEEIGLLASGVAKEVSNPIGSINNKMEMLRENIRDITSYTQLLEYGISRLAEEENPERRQVEMDQITQVQSKMKIEALFSDSGSIIKESRKGLKQVKGVIDTLKTLSSRNEKPMSGIDLNQEIQNMINRVKPELGSGREIVKILEFIPPLTCYPNSLNQSLENLLRYALQTTRAGDKVCIRTSFKDNLIHVIIQYRATIIAPDQVKQLFDPFFKTKVGGKGSGLDLYLSKHIVKNHGGTLSVESVPGERTTFIMQLPVAEVEVFVHPALTIPAM